MQNYVYPKFSTLGAFGLRTGGPGLGNLFFPYARALLLAKQHGWTLINPSWTTVKLGTLLRRERNKRWYMRVFRPQGIAGPRKTFLLLTCPKVTEAAAGQGHIKPGSIVLTSGLGDFFKDIAQERDYLASRFKDLLRAEDAALIRAGGPYHIGVHVRLGDFQTHQRIPLAWYVQMIGAIRRAAGKEVPATVMSDGSDTELAELLQVPGVKRLDAGVVPELFALSSSKVILASNSTFSAWAAFLGHVPILWGRRDSSFEDIFTDGTANEVLASDAELPPPLAVQLRRTL